MDPTQKALRAARTALEFYAKFETYQRRRSQETCDSNWHTRYLLTPCPSCGGTNLYGKIIVRDDPPPINNDYGELAKVVLEEINQLLLSPQTS